MATLGYSPFVAHGGDWGGVVTTILGGRFPGHVIGVHTTTAQPPPGYGAPLVLSSNRTGWAGRGNRAVPGGHARGQ